MRQTLHENMCPSSVISNSSQFVDVCNWLTGCGGRFRQKEVLQNATLQLDIGQTLVGRAYIQASAAQWWHQRYSQICLLSGSDIRSGSGSHLKDTRCNPTVRDF